VRRNVVINVGGGSAPVQGQISRGTAVPRPPVPYVVREGSYPMPTASRRTGAQAAPPASELPPVPSTRDIRMPWDAPASGELASRTRTPGPSTDPALASRAEGPEGGSRARPPGPPPERAPAESAFSTDLPNDKSLDEVILEYLSDDPE